VLEYGTGAINVDGCRIGTETRVNPSAGNKPGGASLNMSLVGMPDDVPGKSAEGRWPPNIILTHSPDCTDDDCADDCPVAEMNRQSGDTKSVKRSPTDKDSRGIPNDSNMVMRRQDTVERGFADTGGASRFFPCFRYNAKAPKKERPIVEGLPGHPTVKPVALMQWLVKLVTPPNGVVLDPFAGTGTTAEACLKEGLYCILIERDPDSIRRIDARLDKYNSTKEAA
jgi:site-specific DNA-methyltransferase (adenine-specific)